MGASRLRPNKRLKITKEPPETAALAAVLSQGAGRTWCVRV